MQTVSAIVETQVKQTFRLKQIAGMFDIDFKDKSRLQWDVDLPIGENDWKIGLIVGPSGSGKTTIGMQIDNGKAYYSHYDWPKDKSILDGFNDKTSIKDITHALTSVGLSSVPTWCRPFSVLSNGEKFRAELARILLDDKALTVIDEFTSVIDRQVAKIGSCAFKKAVNKLNRQFIMLSCHYDIIEWLCPDWTYDFLSGEFSRRLLRRPDIKLEIWQCKKELWNTFSKHHYLSGKINTSAKCFLATIDNAPACFLAMLPSMGYKDTYRIHRIVTLPDYQGVGIASALMNWVANSYHSNGKKVTITTSHPSMIHYLSKSKLWRIRQINKNGQKNYGKFKNATNSFGRCVVSAFYKP